jgi:N-carbamoylputrescine amidase
MPRLVRCSLIQTHTDASPDLPLPDIKHAMIDKHLGYIRQAAEAGAHIICLQEIFNGPYFCAEQQARWYDFTEPVPEGPTIRLMQDVARRHRAALIVPAYEREQPASVYGGDALWLSHRGRHARRTQ